MQDKMVIERIERKFRRLEPDLNERTRRIWAASEAMELGHGGISAVAKATGVAYGSIRAGVSELMAEGKGERVAGGGPGIRRAGGGRKSSQQKDPLLLPALLALVEPGARGDPQSPLQWTIKSTRVLARELTKQQHPVSHATVAGLLEEAKFSLQANRKTREGGTHPDRNAQFEHINGRVMDFLRRRQPAISVDTKKKELVGDFRNAGREYRPQGQPELVRVHDFIDKDLGKAIPYGVYDLSNNQGWVSVGIDHDTAPFAANTIARWWLEMGAERFPKATELLVMADGGGSNSSRSRAWKVALQKLADQLGLNLHICHFPPGTSKWNKIEHRLFSFITQNWRGKPLLSRQAVVELIGSTKTEPGLVVKAALDTNLYPTGIKVTDAELAAVNITSDSFHPEWNYSIGPRPK
jgi:Rhodopirellula transposase DDE domain